jgi:formylglycine-generating enzyme required for sulfatase activity/tRNA A-37 threonylcarbamoyl transferase component Bud32
VSAGDEPAGGAEEEKLFAAFLERFEETGDLEVPFQWPAALQKRCRFFARMLEGGVAEGGAGGAGGAEESLVSRLEGSGIRADLSLQEAGGPAPAAAEGFPGRGRERYRFEGEIARGGMGRILLAYDRDFRRRIAVKVMRGTLSDARRASRFLEEAQATAQLEHPNIGSVYDLGVTPSGSPFFTMKWIRGRNLKEILSAAEGRPSLVGLVQILQQAAMGVHFANSRGVVHRDLKPHNIMVGDFGEVLVVDWGLAKIVGRAGGDGEDDPGVSTARAEEGETTIEGAIQGSPAYMAPEQAWGEIGAIDARTDVFGLGAILYEILTGSPPYNQASVDAALGSARRGAVVPPRERAPDRAIPPALEAACRKALAAPKEERFQSARELHAALQGFIEGIHDAERRAAEARRLRALAEAQRGELERAEAAEAELRRRREELRAAIADHDSEEKKQPWWELTARWQAAREEAAAAFDRTLAAYLAVLSVEPGDAAARSALAEIYYRRLLEAEERGDRAAAGLYRGLVAQHHDGRYAVELQGEGLLRLESDPPGARVELRRYEERGPLLAETAPASIGTTPLERRLPPGSYLALLEKPGFQAARYPFLIGRSSSHAGGVRLHAEGSIASGFLQVAGGESIIGGNPEELPALPRGRRMVGELFAARFPVTFREYCEFLNDAFAGERPDLRDHLPFFGSEEYVRRDKGGVFGPIPTLDPETPVLALSIEACEAYCRWLGRKLGRNVRLLEEVEWERCARGADGRLYPWGNGFDWAFCKGRPSRPGEPYPEPAGAFPRDLSPFGVRDLAGGVRELCAGLYSPEYRPLRGGSWYNNVPLAFRADYRSSRREGTRTTDAGFRVCYDQKG